MAKRNLPSWVRLHADWPENERFWELSAESFRLWAHSVVWAKKNGSDGDAPPGRIARQWGAPRGCLDELVSSGLWHLPGHTCADCPQPPQGMVHVHHWLEWQESKADSDRLRERGRKAAETRWTRANSEEHATSNAPSMQEAMQDRRLKTEEQEELSSEPQARSVPAPAPRQRRSSSPEAIVDLEFDRWWELYPRKDAKGQARKAYRAAAKKVGPQVLLEAVRAQREALVARKAEGFCPLPSTWLNGERWGDEVAVPEEDEEFQRQVQQWLLLHPLAEPDELVELWSRDQGAARAWSERLKAERLGAARAAVLAERGAGV